MSMERKAKRKRILLLVILVMLVVSCIPVKFVYKDGGTVAYKAVLYSYTKYHRLTEDGSGNVSYYEDDVFRFFPFNYFD